MLDTIIRGCNLQDGRTGIDIGVKDGAIAEVGTPSTPGPMRRSMPRAGWWCRPSSTATCISMRC